jgi:arylsulfatase A-like enzyme
MYFDGMKRHQIIPLLMGWALLLASCGQEQQPLPNILWITSEDNGPFLGCYGDPFATTPHLDQLASEGFMYTNAYANTPVCAPARNTIITGVYACSSGNEQMRSRYAKSETVRYYTEFLRSLGYYCTNNSKTDYNTGSVDLEAMWDQCSREAHYRNRGEGQPFFAIFNLTTSHESSIHNSIPPDQLRHRPEEVTLPPYHPDTPEMRHDWAQYYDKIEDMDRQVGALLLELEEEGLAEYTIVFYYSDHGGVLGRSKRFLYETGTHVPFIVRIPEKYRHLYPAGDPGSEVDRLISFVDLAPTLLSLTNQEPPAFMQGSAFLGKYIGEEPEVVYMFRDRMDGRYDMSRSIVDGAYRYTRNFNPRTIYLQHLNYLWRAPSMRSWEEAFLSGKCNEVQARWWKSKPLEELYHISDDPWEVNNLAGDPRYEEKLISLRQQCLALNGSITDAGFIPEAERNIRAGDTPIYDYIRSGSVPLEKIIQVAWKATEAVPEEMDQLLGWLKDGDSAVRYWAAQGLLLLGEHVRPQLGQVVEAAYDPSWNVSVLGAEILYRLGEKGDALPAYRCVLQGGSKMARTDALNSIDRINGSPEEFADACAGVIRDKYSELNMGSDYDARVIQWLFRKWEIEPSAYGISFP